MKYYLSSYKMGKETKKLRRMLPRNKKAALIINASDAYKNKEKMKKGEVKNIRALRANGMIPETLDLKDYFGEQKKLEKKLSEFGIIWVKGGNTFVLRQAMRLSGFDKIFKKLQKRKDLLYGGYSAGICILSKSMKGLEIVDDPTERPYGKKSKVIWEGLGMLDYMILPHYKSKHPESKMVGKTVQYFIDNKMLFRVLHDGEVIIIE